MEYWLKIKRLILKNRTFSGFNQIHSQALSRNCTIQIKKLRVEGGVNILSIVLKNSIVFGNTVNYV